jgi:16S rRNA (uracil1498-N3)-methyltransferase
MKGAPRFHLPSGMGPDVVGTEMALPDAPAHHAVRVLRLTVGAAITLFTGDGGEFAATLVRADKRSAWVRIERFDPVEREAPMAITLVQGIAANDAMDTIVRRSVELGVAAIQPVVSARGARFPDGERGAKRLAHWRQIAVAACEQCGRNRVPDVHEVVELDAWLAGRVDADMNPAIILAPEAEHSLVQHSMPGPAFQLLVGPEGGWTAAEVARAVHVGSIAARLGPRVLRTETASAAGLAAINILWGDFR